MAELDVVKLHGRGSEGEPQPIDRVLARPGGVVLLGGPGSGKTTLVKRLARSLALGSEVAKERYPELSWSFPIVLPVALFEDQRDGRGVDEYVRDLCARTGGRALVEVFAQHWSGGRCLVLLDGLDEVADAGRRIGCAHAVEELLNASGGNRVLVTSRPVGYSICRLSVPAEHVLLEPFARADVETFVRRWHQAYDRAVHLESPDPQQADADAEDLIGSIRESRQVESLATNPLMLTIIALIKQQRSGGRTSSPLCTRLFRNTWRPVICDWCGRATRRSSAFLPSPPILAATRWCGWPPDSSASSGGRWATIEPDSGGRVQLYLVADAGAQAAAIVRRLGELKRLDPDLGWRDCAVLARRHAVLQPIRAMLEEAGIPVRWSADGRLPPLHRVREIAAYLRRLDEIRRELRRASQLEVLRRELAGEHEGNPWWTLLAELLREWHDETGDSELTVSAAVEYVYEALAERRRE